MQAARPRYTGPLWRLYNSAYDNIRSIVKLNGHMSEEFKEGQGIRQGGLTSADAYNGNNDANLNNITCQNEGFKIGAINIGGIMVADNLTLLSTTPQGLQTLITIAEYDAQTRRYIFSETKTRLQYVLVPQPLPNDIILNQRPLTLSNAEVHLGICRRDDMSNGTTITDRIKTARGTVYALAGAGLYGRGCWSRDNAGRRGFVFQIQCSRRGVGRQGRR